MVAWSYLSLCLPTGPRPIQLSVFTRQSTHTHVNICINGSLLFIQFYRLVKPKNMLFFSEAYFSEDVSCVVPDSEK